MTTTEFKRALRKATAVFVWVKFQRWSDGEYIAVPKKTGQIILDEADQNMEILSHVRDDGALYIG